MNSVNDFIKSIKNVLSPQNSPATAKIALFIVIGFTLDYLFKSDDESCGRRSCGSERRLSWVEQVLPESVMQASAEWKRATWVPGGDAGRTVVAILVFFIIFYAIALIFKVFLRLFDVSEKKNPL